MYLQRAQFLYSFENRSANFEVKESNTVIQSALQAGQAECLGA